MKKAEQWTSTQENKRTSTLANKQYLVFEGGGAKGLAYTGALVAGEEHGLNLKTLKGVAGASAGAIQAMLVALQYSTEEMFDLVVNTDWTTFFDDKWGIIRDSANLLQEYGWHPGEIPLQWFEDRVEDKLGDRQATFADVLNVFGVELVVVVCNLSRGGYPQLLGPKTTPDFPVAEAVRASMAIPYIFEPVVIDDEELADGGLQYNYPIGVWDKVTKEGKVPNTAVLGFRADSEEEIQYYKTGELPESKGRSPNIVEFTKRVAGAFAQAQDIHVAKQKEHWRTIYINTQSVQMLDFELTMEQKGDLLNQGYTATKEFMKK